MMIKAMTFHEKKYEVARLIELMADKTLDMTTGWPRPYPLESILRALEISAIGLQANIVASQPIEPYPQFHDGGKSGTIQA